MSLLYDKIMMKLYNKKMNYFDFSNEIYIKIKKMIIKKLFSKEII